MGRAGDEVATMRDTRFWIMLALFEVAFGLTVFAATRHYYLSRQPPATELPAWAVGLGAALPSAAPAPASPNSTPPFAAASPPAATPATGGPGATDPNAMATRAEDAFNAGRYDEAAQLFQQLLILDPQNVELHNELGLTLHYAGRSDEALKVLAAGLAIDPNHQRSWLTTGFVNLQSGKTAEAHAALIKARDVGDNAEIRESAEKMLAGLPQ
jgi:tetratricopeptide (TPR) repeat protein